MKRNIKFLTFFLAIFLLSAQSIFANKLDDWLDKYEELIVKIEGYVQEGNQAKVDKAKKEREKLFAEKDKIQEKEGNFSFFQGTRYGALNARYGVAIAALKTSKELQKAADELDKKSEQKDNSKKNQDKGKFA